MLHLIDTHIHLDDSRFDKDRDDVYTRAINNGVDAMIVPAVTSARWSGLESVANSYKNIYSTIGLHPMFCNEHQETDLTLLENKLTETKYTAIGECGLDGSIDKSSMAAQMYYFSAQLALANRFRLPIIIHARGAVEQVILTLKEQALSNPNGNGVIHSYNGSLQQAHRLIDLGFILSFGGAITYNRSHRLHKLVQQLPLDSIMLETDAPDQPPKSYQGQRNEPGYIKTVLAAAATLRKQEPEEIANYSNNNASRLFNLPEPS